MLLRPLSGAAPGTGKKGVKVPDAGVEAVEPLTGADPESARAILVDEMNRIVTETGRIVGNACT